MQQVNLDALRRVKSIYPYFFILMFAIILFVFFEPTIRRLSEGAWIRGRFVQAWTLSLDIHAIVAYGFLALIGIQFFFGHQQTRFAAFKIGHAKLGKVLFYFVIPALLLVNFWVVFDRAFNIAQEDSVIFRSNRIFAIILMTEILVFVAWYAIRSLRALREGDIITHIDSVLGLLMCAGIVAVIRFLYAIFWAIRGGSPFSAAGMFFLSISLVVVMLALAHALAGRFAQNRMSLLAIVLVTILLAVAGAGHYTFMDV